MSKFEDGIDVFSKEAGLPEEAAAKFKEAVLQVFPNVEYAKAAALGDLPPELLGGGAGAGVGVLASLLTPRKDRSPWSDILTGAGLGALGGTVYRNKDKITRGLDDMRIRINAENMPPGQRELYIASELLKRSLK